MRQVIRFPKMTNGGTALSWIDEDGSAVHLTTGHYESLPLAREDGYDWQRFFGHQAKSPFIFHGTSSVFANSIKEKGLSYSERRWSFEVAERIVELFERRKLYGPG